MLQAAPSAFRPRRRTWRALAGAFVTFGGVGLIFLFGARLLGLDGAAAMRSWLAAASASPWALPATVAIFAVLAFLGVPQVVLIAAAIVALGPWAGMADSWAGTLVSALIGFGLGRRFGAGALRDRGGARIGRILGVIARNGFLASLLIRLAPTAPFVFVNMAAGAAEVSLADFAAGTAIGIVPKIGLIALTGGSVVGLTRGGGAAAALAVAFGAAGWIALSLASYAWLRRREAGRDAEVGSCRGGVRLRLRRKKLA